MGLKKVLPGSPVEGGGPKNGIWRSRLRAQTSGMRGFWRDLWVGLGAEGCWQVMRRRGRYRLRSAVPRSPQPPYPGSSGCSLQVARPACAEGGARPDGACLLPPPLPLCPPVRTRGRPQGRDRGTDWRRLLPAKSQAGRPKPVRPALAERLPRTYWTQKRREGGREGGESRAGRQLLPPLTRRPI